MCVCVDAVCFVCFSAAGGLGEGGGSDSGQLVSFLSLHPLSPLFFCNSLQSEADTSLITGWI